MARKETKVHPDHRIVFDKSYYSLPTRYIGKKVWVRGGIKTVQIFLEGELIKTHQRAYRPGSWRTDESDYPPEQSRYIMRSVSHYQAEALKYGEHVHHLITKLMTEHAYMLAIIKREPNIIMVALYKHVSNDLENIQDSCCTS
ncbi:MAG: hypothetical protein AB1480_12575 [Nitrospirota bacterium]